MGILKIRKPAVAGQFYPKELSQLKKQIEDFILKDAPKKEVIACLLPHAGYIYSGKVAGYTVSHIKIKEKVILIGPNHTGLGKPFGIMTEGIWQTPFGELHIDSDLAKNLLKHSDYLQEDVLSHLYEHSLEVELPFLQYFKDSFHFVPITVMADDIYSYKNLGKEIAEVINELNLKSSTLMIASSDMTHYETQASAIKKDKLAIEAILELNEDKLWEKVNSDNISMCGCGPAAIMLSYAKSLGAKNAELIRYQTSADVNRDYSAVVGYAGIIVY